MRHVALNRAQRALWFAQQVVGDDVPIVIAQCLEIVGPLDAGILASCIDDVCAELGMSTARLVADGTSPLSLDLSGRPTSTEFVSLREAPDPERSAAAWMAAATEEPLDVGGPLLRCVLLELGPSRWTFYARAHHLLLDGYAAGLMMRHAAHRYRQRVGASAGSAAPPAPRGVEVILEHEKAYGSSARRHRDREHWRRVVSAMPEPLRLADRSVGTSASSHVVGADLDVSPASVLGAAATRVGVPTVALLVAACSLSLSRIADRSTTPLTLVTSARTTAALRAAAGTMSNLLPILVEQTGGASVDEHLHTVAATLSEALRHQQFRYEDMIEDHTLGRFGPVVNLVPSIPDVSLGDDVQGELRILTTGPVDDVNINVYPGGPDALRLEIEVNADAHDVWLARTLLDGVTGGVRALCTADGRSRVVDLDVFDPVPALGGRPDRRRLTLADEYLRHRESRRTAVIDGDGVEHTYTATAAHADRVAEILRRRARPGDVVAVECARSVHTVVAAWAVAAAGMCVLPVDPALPAERRATMLDDARPSLVLGVGPGVDVDLAEPSGRTVRTAAERAPQVSAESAAYLLYTSGSTGVPKGIIVSHSGIGPLVGEMDDHYDLDESSVVPHLASPGFDTAIVEMLAAAHAGATLVIVPPEVRGGPDLAALLDERGVTHLFVTPAVLATLPADGLRTVTHVIVGGDVCPAPLIRRWTRDRTVRCAYGPTETTCSVTLTEPVDPAGTEPRIPLGAPMRGVRLHVLDRRLRPVPPGGDGELYVSGPSLARGVLGRSALTADRFVASADGDGGRMYRTGDRVRRDLDDRLWFLGRGDAQVKIRGVRVEPAETDRAILATGLVTSSVTVARRTDHEAVLHTYVVPASVPAPADDLPRRLRATVRERVGAPHTPAGVTVLDRLPLTVNNKVDTARLPAPSVGCRPAFRAPTDATERMVTSAFERALGITEIGLDDDFFDLAGDSLSATAVAADINGRAGVRIGVRDVLVSGTPARIAEVVRSSGHDPSADPAPPDRHPTPISPAQRTVFDRRARLDHVIALEVAVPDQMRVSEVRALLGSLIDAHPMLRSRFADDATFTVDDVADPGRWRIETLDAAEDMRGRLHRPIDVATGYPLRAVVAAFDGGTRIGLAFHHLAVDGASLGVMQAGLAAPPRPQPGDYREYARLASARADVHRDGDVAHFAPCASTVVDLDPAAGRPPVWDSRGARLRRPVTREQWDAVGEIARAHRVTELTVLRAALASVICSRSGAEAVAIGALTSGRDDARWAGVVGMFVNTVSVLCPVSASWRATVEAVRRAEDEAFAHSATAFTDVVEALGPFPADRHPLFQVMLTMDQDPPDTPVAVTPLPVDVAHCDLHVSVVPPRGGAVGRVEILYAAALFEETEVERLATELVDAASARSGVR